MILRLSQKLNAKIKAGKLDFAPADENPYADWSCHLFTAERAQYIILSNTLSLYSCVMFGRGVTDDSIFIRRALDAIRDSLDDAGQQFVYRRFVAPSTASVQFAKALNRSVTGSMNDLINHAKIWLAAGELSPHDVGSDLNDILLSALGDGEYGRPAEAFKQLIDKPPSTYTTS